MSYPLTAAAIITIAIGIAHTYLGEKYVLTRLFRHEDLPRLFGSDTFTRRVLRFAWHLTTIAWWGLAVILLVLADHFGGPAPSSAVLTKGSDPLATIGYTVAVILAINAVIIVSVSRGKHLAWPMFTVAAVLTWIGI